MTIYKCSHASTTCVFDRRGLPSFSLRVNCVAIPMASKRLLCWPDFNKLLSTDELWTACAAIDELWTTCPMTDELWTTCPATDELWTTSELVPWQMNCGQLVLWQINWTICPVGTWADALYCFSCLLFFFFSSFFNPYLIFISLSPFWSVPWTPLLINRYYADLFNERKDL